MASTPIASFIKIFFSLRRSDSQRTHSFVLQWFLLASMSPMHFYFETTTSLSIVVVVEMREKNCIHWFAGILAFQLLKNAKHLWCPHLSFMPVPPQKSVISDQSSPSMIGSTSLLCGHYKIQMIKHTTSSSLMWWRIHPGIPGQKSESAKGV